ncbi:MAG: hypothetical protein LKI93_04870 [Bifidobacteriaceae bacterium]|jgi:hypothetical protein|nr:hypothetical protein [Bifidobacteriaceae bacterium]MCI1914393.1 hypothetical protein [Bifidobacteriaceae bacterium]MCI1935845.1 hypothetical protein [Bifidobacteriaceae bacterium]
MKGDSGYKPVKRNVESMDDVFRKDDAEESEEPWLVTSVKMRKSTRTRLKIYALEHDTTMQDIIDRLVTDFLENENK